MRLQCTNEETSDIALSERGCEILFKLKQFEVIRPGAPMSVWCKFGTCKSQPMIVLWFRCLLSLSLMIIIHAIHSWKHVLVQLGSSSDQYLGWGRLLNSVRWMYASSQEADLELRPGAEPVYGCVFWWVFKTLVLTNCMSCHTFALSCKASFYKKKDFTGTPSEQRFSDLHRACQNICCNLVHWFPGHIHVTMYSTHVEL